jgi:NAD+ diphosphatase
MLCGFGALTVDLQCKKKNMDTIREFVPGIVPPAERTAPAWWFVFQQTRLLVRLETTRATLPYLLDYGELGRELGFDLLYQHYLGTLDGSPCFAAEVAEGTAPPTGMAFEGLRQVYGRLDEDLFWVAARAVQIVEWDKTHQFCGRCGIRMTTRPTERARECPQCGLLHFPRLAPAIIVLIERDHHLLLARSRRFAANMYSVLAGFVEPGESLEEAVVREIQEEVGLRVKDIRYFGSQPWPFPHSLMVGFTATYAGGEISIDESEIEDAGWFTVENLPPLPGKISIARKLIDWFIAKHVREERLSRSRE